MLHILKHLYVVGCAGNCLVLATILRSPDMRTARNVFIGNLAVSDLCLCVVTMPLTLVSHSINITALDTFLFVTQDPISLLSGFCAEHQTARSSRSVANVNSKQIEIILNPAKPHIQLYLAARPEIS